MRKTAKEVIDVLNGERKYWELTRDHPNATHMIDCLRQAVEAVKASDQVVGFGGWKRVKRKVKK